MTVSCEGCGKTFEAQRSSARFCGATCRKRVSRQAVVPPPAKEDTPEPAEPSEPALVTAARQDLAAAGRLHTMLGQQALHLAARLAEVTDTGSGVAALNKELRATMAAALANAKTADDDLDELAQRRLEKARGA